MPCKSPAEDTAFGTALVSQQPVQMPAIQRSVGVELGIALVSQQLPELHHAPSVQHFAVRLGKRFVKSSYSLSSSYIRAVGKIRLTLLWHNS
ncbi:hypothetical protein TNCV_1760261 [Trichonephila clavipes]|nr:hypothetical protein TNCV_1760261 [Trichonephila clavipes]